MVKTGQVPSRPSSFQISGQVFEAEHAAAGLHVIATPIGNLEDITIRALRTLAGADLVLCEDSRITRRLFDRYAIRAPLRTYHDHNGEKVRPEILAKLREGLSIALVSDAGTPLVSDPGFKLVREAIDQGIAVHGVPGPSAPVMGLTLSGLPSDRFIFAGFLPQKQGARRLVLEELNGLNATLIFFDSAKRVKASLESISEVLGNRDVVIARELTKLHEEFIRGTADELRKIDRSLKGEVTLLIGPPAEPDAMSEADIDLALSEALERLPVGRAASEVAAISGVNRKQLYERALRLKDPGG